MNQTEQMREALRDCVKTMHQWRMCELGLIAGPTEDEIESVVTKAEQALTAEYTPPPKEYTPPKPAKLVRLTDEEIEACIEKGKKSFSRHRKLIRGMIFLPQDTYEWHVCQATMDALGVKNKGQL